MRTTRLWMAVVLFALAGAVTATGTAPTPAAGAAAEPSAASLDAALADGLAATGAPGATAAVVKDGRLLWSGAAGSTAVSGGAPMAPDTRFAIASTTKTVTAVIAMKLILAGRLSLRTRLSFAEPQLPNARLITVRMLLKHISGLGDYFADGYVDRMAYQHPGHHWTRREVLSHIGRPDFPPGARFEYSNSGYVALGGILVKASGSGIEALFQRFVGGPVGMAESTFAYTPSLSGSFAHPHYQRRDGSVFDASYDSGLVGTDYWGPVWTDGGLASTSPDLARFGNALFSGSLLPSRTVAQMLPAGPHGYGFGTYFWNVDGTRWTGHDGVYGGYETDEWTDRGSGLTVAVMTNMEESSNRASAAAVIWRRVAAAASSASGLRSSASR